MQLEPVLFAERNDGRTSQLNLPEYAQQGRQIFFLLFGLCVHTAGRIGDVFRSRFRSGPEAEVRQGTAFRWRDLPMGDLVEKNGCFSAGGNGLSVPTEAASRIRLKHGNAETPCKRNGLFMAVVQISVQRRSLIPRGRNPPEGRLCIRRMSQGAVHGVQHVVKTIRVESC